MKGNYLCDESISFKHFHWFFVVLSFPNIYYGRIQHKIQFRMCLEGLQHTLNCILTWLLHSQPVRDINSSTSQPVQHFNTCISKSKRDINSSTSKPLRDINSLPSQFRILTPTLLKQNIKTTHIVALRHLTPHLISSRLPLLLKFPPSNRRPSISRSRLVP